jgi:hypothetical protein
LSTKRYKLYDADGGFLRLCSEQQKDSLIALGKVTADERDGRIRGLHYRRDDPDDRRERHTGTPSISNEPKLNTKFTYHEHIEGTTVSIIQHKMPWHHRDASAGCEYFIRQVYWQVQLDCIAKPDFRALAKECEPPLKQAA